MIASAGCEKAHCNGIIYPLWKEHASNCSFFDFPNYRPSFYVYPTQEKKIRQPIPNCLGRISDHILHVLGTYNAIAGTHSEMTGSFFLLHFYKILLKAQAMNTNHFLR